MADAKVSTFATKAANTCTFTYAYVVADGAYGKVAINASGGLPVYTTTSLTPYADNTNSIGTTALRWVNLQLTLGGHLVWNAGDGSSNFLSYVDAVGPAFTDRTVSKTQRFNVQSLSAVRTATFQDSDGTVAWVNSQAFTGVPTAPTAAPDTDTTQLATCEFVMTEIPRFFISPTVATVTAGNSVVISSVDCVINQFIYLSVALMATLTLTLPDGVFDGQITYVSINNIVTALTMGGTNLEATNTLAQPTAWVANQCIGWSWNAGSSKWVRFQ